jgi:putative SOS response-associated peptidase YedK
MVLEERFGARFPDEEPFAPFFFVSAWDLPGLPVITDEEPGKMRLAKWGLIPSWLRDRASAEDLRKKTFNARAETVFEKPAFRHSIRSGRCLVPVDGFYEWREHGGKKYPYFMHLKDESPFALAGLWDRWVDPETGAIAKTFSIITKPADELMSLVHNTKMRMPAILEKADEKTWIDASLKERDIRSLLLPRPHHGLEASPVSRLISSKRGDRNRPEARLRFEYPDLPPLPF